MKRLLIISVVVLGLMISPCFAIEYCKDFLESGNTGGWSASLKTFDDEWTMGVGDEIELDIWINDVPESLITAGYYIQFDPALVSIINVIPYNADNGVPWDPALTNSLEVEPGVWMLAVAEWPPCVAPDGDGDVILAKVTFECQGPGDANITISTIPTFDTVVNCNGTYLYDPEIQPNTITIHQTEADICEGDFDNDGDQDGSDAALFKTDFGRSTHSNPCPSTTTTTITSFGCPYGMVDCVTKCVDPLTDEEYCGADSECVGATVCVAGEICDGGVCILNCPPGQFNCGGQCVNTETDESHCGGCFNFCGSGELCVASSCEAVGSSYQAAVEKTGQTICYDETGTTISCEGTGQDGEYQKGVPWPNPRLTDNGDGTVTDNLTGLIWLKDANCFGLRTWNDALSDSNGLEDGECGLADGSSTGDWRLPNKKELLSLLDDGNSVPPLPSGHPFTTVQNNPYWTSTTLNEFPETAWIQHNYYGLVHGNVKTNVNYVWPVRGGH